MNRSEIARLLALAAAFDRRTVGDADVLAWSSILGDVAFIDAELALRQHFAESSDYLMPADIRRRVRANREAAAERRRHEILRAELRAIEQAPANAREGIAKVSEALAAARGLDPEKAKTEDAERRRIRSVGCPYCGAAPFRPCVMRISEDERGDAIPLRLGHHPSRIELANG